MLRDQANLIGAELEAGIFSISCYPPGGGFGERVQTSSSNSSYMEKELMRIVEVKLQRIENKKVEIEKLEEQKDMIKIRNTSTKDILEQLNDEYRKIIELKYKHRHNEQKIALEVHLSQSQVNKKIRRALRIIHEWNSWSGINLE